MTRREFEAKQAVELYHQKAERAAILLSPTDDFNAEYKAFCERMGYVGEKLASIKSKMKIYDEFQEYDYRKHYNGATRDVSHDRGNGRGVRWLPSVYLHDP